MMDPSTSSSDSEEEFFDLTEPTLNSDHVSRFLAMFEDKEQSNVQQYFHPPSDINNYTSFETERSNTETTGLTLQRPSKFQTPIESTYSPIPPRECSNSAVTKTGKYVSEMKIDISTEKKQEAMKTKENNQGHKVEDISAIDDIQSGSENSESNSPVSEAIRNVKRQQAVTTLANFFAKISQESLKLHQSSGKEVTPLQVTVTSDDISTPVKATSPLPSPQNRLFYSKENTPEFSTIIQDGLSPSTPNKSPKYILEHEYPEIILPLGKGMPVDEEKEPLSPLTSPNNRSWKINCKSANNTDVSIMSPLPYNPNKSKFTETLVSVGDVDMEMTKFKFPVSKNVIVKEPTTASAGFSRPQSLECLQPDGDDLPPPPPSTDEAPPLPTVLPPFFPSGLIKENVSSEEEALLLAFLKTLRSGKTGNVIENQNSFLSKNIKVDQLPNQSKLNVTESKETLVIPKVSSKSVVTQLIPKRVISPGLPKWPPESDSQNSQFIQKSPDSKRSEEFLKDENAFGKKDSAWKVSESLREDEEGNPNGRETNIHGVRVSDQSDKNDESTAWEIDYLGGNTTNQISCESSERENGEEKRQTGNTTPGRTSVVELLRSNSSAGHRGKPCWQLSVDTDDALNGLTIQQVELCELKFELITTEAEYFSRLQFLVTNFCVDNFSDHAKATLKSDSHKNIFLDLEEVCEHSNQLLQELEHCWKKNIYLERIFDVITKHFKANKNVLINYCSSYPDVIQKIGELRKKDNKFDKMISSHLECDRIEIDEQLREPMNRIMHLNLLLKNCCKVMGKLEVSMDQLHKEAESCKDAAACVEQVCLKVDMLTGIRQKVQIMVEIQNRLVFPADMTQLSLTSHNRWLIKRGTMTQIGSLVIASSKVAFKKSSSPLTIFLFNDLIILTKMKSESSFIVKDYSWRPGVVMKQVHESEDTLGLPAKLARDSSGYYPIFMTFDKNNLGNTAYMFLSCADDVERNLWIEAMQKTREDHFPI